MVGFAWALAITNTSLLARVPERVTLLVVDQVGEPLEAGRYLTALLMSRDGSRLFVADQNADAVRAIDTVTMQMIGKPMPTGDAPTQMALSPDGRQIFRDVLDKLIGLLAEPLTTSRLLAASGSYNEFITTLTDLLQS